MDIHLSLGTVLLVWSAGERLTRGRAVAVALAAGAVGF